MFEGTLNPLSLIFFLFAALYLSAKKVDPKLLVALLVGGVLLFSSSQNQDTIGNSSGSPSGSPSGSGESFIEKYGWVLGIGIGIVFVVGVGVITYNKYKPMDRNDWHNARLE